MHYSSLQHALTWVYSGVLICTTFEWVSFYTVHRSIYMYHRYAAVLLGAGRASHVNGRGPHHVESVSCRVLQCGAVWCSVVQCGAVWCSVLQCAAV